MNYFDETRLDVIIKYLYVKAYVENNNYQYYKNLYINSIKLINGGIEDDKSSVDNFLEKFNTLIDSIQKKGFDKNFPIPVGENNIILNGAHRLAVCMYFNIEPKIENKKEISKCNYDLDFFKKGGIKEKDIFKLINTYSKFKQQLNIFILWEPSKKYWNKIKTDISKEYQIIFDYTFKLDKKSMRNLIREMYVFEYNFENSNYIDLKIKNLEHFSRNQYFYVIITKSKKEKEFDRGGKIALEDLINLKEKIRDKMNKILPKELFITLHTNDNLSHSQYLINLIFNDNNLKYLNLRSKKFVNKLDKKLLQFQKILNLKDISKQEICIVEDSVLELCGIRESKDLDIISKTSLNFEYNDEFIETHKRDINIEKTKISDDEIIYNHDYHFYYKGFKFMNLELIKLRKDKHNKKEAFDIKLIDNFLKQKQHNKINYLEEINFKIRVFIFSIYWKIVKISIKYLSESQKNFIKKILKFLRIKF
ncbi:MAG: hypothetical protein LAT82_02060 [Nanoarchaeota archaeon]|nr:hypothetical protein [Nanoarchaeota archaeon]